MHILSIIKQKNLRKRESSANKANFEKSLENEFLPSTFSLKTDLSIYDPSLLRERKTRLKRVSFLTDSFLVRENCVVLFFRAAPRDQNFSNPDATLVTGKKS